MPVIPIKLESNLVEKLDALVGVGKFKNRSHAIREILNDRLAREGIVPQADKEREKRINRVIQLMQSQKQPFFHIITEKTAVDLITEGRER